MAEADSFLSDTDIAAHTYAGIQYKVVPYHERTVCLADWSVKPVIGILGRMSSRLEKS